MSSLVITVLSGTTLLGCVAGIVGSYSVLRRRALVGDLLSHAALPGLCLAFLAVGRVSFAPMLVGAFVSGLAGVALITLIARWTRTKEDAAIGVVLSTFFGGGIVLSSIIQRRQTGSSAAGIDSYIYGQAAAMTGHDVRAIAIVSLFSLAIVTLLYKEFKVFSFDPEFARAQGWPPLVLDLTMMGLLALVTVIGLPAVGVVLMAAMLITPAAAARFWTDRLSLLLLLAGLIGAVSGAAGTVISAGLLADWLGYDPFAFGRNDRGLPTGPVIVLCGAALFLASMFFAPLRGILPRLWRELHLRETTARENLLRSLYELSESSGPAAEITRPELESDRSWNAWTLGRLLRRARRLGWLEATAGGFRLTKLGWEKAAEVTRKHRLWELYLIERANIAADHVDRDADMIEHVLTPAIVGRLAGKLDEGEHSMDAAAVPHSPHDLTVPAARSETSRG